MQATEILAAPGRRRSSIFSTRRAFAIAITKGGARFSTRRALPSARSPPGGGGGASALLDMAAAMNTRQSGVRRSQRLAAMYPCDHACDMSLQSVARHACVHTVHTVLMGSAKGKLLKIYILAM